MTNGLRAAAQRASTCARARADAVAPARHARWNRRPRTRRRSVATLASNPASMPPICSLVGVRVQPSEARRRRCGPEFSRVELGHRVYDGFRIGEIAARDLIADTALAEILEQQHEIARRRSSRRSNSVDAERGRRGERLIEAHFAPVHVEASSATARLDGHRRRRTSQITRVGASRPPRRLRQSSTHLPTTPISPPPAPSGRASQRATLESRASAPLLRSASVNHPGRAAAIRGQASWVDVKRRCAAFSPEAPGRRPR